MSALLAYWVQWTIHFWDCTGLPPKDMQKVLSEEVTTTQNALPPDFEGELSLFANGTPVTPAAVKALDKRLEETTKQAKKIDKKVMKQDAKQEAKQATKVASTLKAAGKRTSASSQSSRLMKSPFPVPAPDENSRHDTTGPVAAGTPNSKASQSKASPATKPFASASQSAHVPEATVATGEVKRKTRGVKRPRPPFNTQEEAQTGPATRSSSSTSAATKIPTAQDMHKFFEKSGGKRKKK